MFTIDNDCLKCGLCAELCPARVIKFEKGRSPQPVPEAESRCIRCGQCVVFCPVGAFVLNFQPKAERRAIDPAELPSAEAAETFLRSRRSIRRFKNEPANEALVVRILESVRYAPSASNSQPVRWIVIRERKSLLELGLMTAGYFQKRAEGKDEPRLKHLAAVADAQERGQDVIFRNAPQLALAVVSRDYLYPEDAAIALTYFELAAHALGVGCCWAGYFTSAARENEEIQKYLKLSPEELVVGGQMFGLPQEPALGKILPPRKEPDLTWL